jgi:methylated-DNA-[protein]-cysteine S-methyltransferase
MKHFSDVETPLGSIRIVADDSAVIAVGFDPDNNAKLARFGLTGEERANDLSKSAAAQVDEYFAGKRQSFDLPVSFAKMTPFSQQVLHCLNSIPYGEILSYGALAALAGRPGAARAIGRVMAANPIPIIVPCHRIVGSNGKMTGYSGGEGIATKEWLLAFEHEHLLS